MLNLNMLAGFNGMLQPLPVFQPGLGFNAVISAGKQQHAVDVARQTGKLIAILVAERIRKGGLQLGGMTGKMNIRETLKVFRDFGLRFRIQKARQPRVTRNSVSASFAEAACGL